MGVTLAVDAMSGDRGPASVVSAVSRSLEANPDLEVLLVGKPDRLEPLLPPAKRERVEIVGASEVVEMNESPVAALRQKKDSSMRRAIDLVAEDRAQAVVSAGNTGALMATATVRIGLIDGIERAAIASHIPNRHCTDSTCVLDLGANVDCTERMLLQFGVMGTALTMAVKEIESPTISLLNVGVENIKGSDLIKKACALFEQSNLNFQGSIEGNAIFDATATDVVVCDGFSGNVALKTIEGLSKMIKEMIERRFRRNLLTMGLAALASPVLGDLRRTMDHRRYNGACFVGLRQTVVKSHGNADSVAFAAAIATATQAVQHDLPVKTREIVGKLSA